MAVKAVLGPLLLLLALHPVYAGKLTLNQQLVLACYEREVVQVVACLRKGADVNARFGESDCVIVHFLDRWTGGAPVSTASWTPLIALASSPEYPAPPAGSGDIWRDPERSALIRKQIPRERIQNRHNDAMAILYILLANRCSLEAHDGYGATALFEAVDKGDVPLVRTLLHFGANPNIRVQPRIDGPGSLSPLHVACRSQELVQLLLDHGADASVKDSEGRTPADWIALPEDRTFDLLKTPGGWHVCPRSARLPSHEKRVKPTPPAAK